MSAAAWLNHAFQGDERIRTVCRACRRLYERERRGRVHVDEADIRADLRLVEGVE